MADLPDKYSPDKLAEIEAFLTDRFRQLETQRSQMDSLVRDEVAIYENVDKKLDQLPAHYDKIRVNYVYSAVQTIKSRVRSSLFAYDDYIKIYSDQPQFYDIEMELTTWVQEELDKISFKEKATDAIEEALKKRLAWLQIRPVPLEKEKDNPKEYRMEVDLIDFYDVYFDTYAKTVMDSDFFVRKTKRWFEMQMHEDWYFNLDQIKQTNYDEIMQQTEAYEENRYKHGRAGTEEYTYYDSGFKYDRKVELLEWYGLFDMAEGDEDTRVPEYKEMLFTLANREVLVRVDENDMDLWRTRLMFPLRGIRQGESLVGKSIAQVLGDIPHVMNEIESYKLQNYKQLVKLLWKFNKHADIDLTSLFSGAGNGVPYDQGPDDVLNMTVNNVLQESMAMSREYRMYAQELSGAVESLQGISPSGSQTATETRSNVSEAMVRIGMITENFAMDIRDFLNYFMIMLIKFNRGAIEARHPRLFKFFEENQVPAALENSYAIDILTRDLSQRRDIEQSRWTSMFAPLSEMVSASGGNTTLLLRQFMQAFNMRGINAILTPESAGQIVSKLIRNPQMAQEVIAGLQQATAQAQGELPGTGTAPAIPAPDTDADIERMDNRE